MQSEPQNARTLVWALPLSLAATCGITVVFSSSGYLDVSVHRVPSVLLCIRSTVYEVCSYRFPHSDTCGSRPVCGSPQLFAAYCVFHRLPLPGHPPCALCILDQTGSRWDPVKSSDTKPIAVLVQTPLFSHGIWIKVSNGQVHLILLFASSHLLLREDQIFHLHDFPSS